MNTVIFESEREGLLVLPGGERIDMRRRRTVVKTGDCFILQFFPYGGEFESVCERVRLPDFCSESVKVIDWGNCVFSVYLCPKRRRRQRPLTPVCQAECAGGLVTLCDDGELYLLVEGGEQMSVLPIDFYGESARVYPVRAGGRSAICLEIAGAMERYFGLYAYADGFITLYEGIGSDFKLQGDILYQVKQHDNMFHCSTERAYRITGDGCLPQGVKLLKNDFRYEMGMPVPLKLCAFLEGVQTGCEELCYPLLSGELKQGFSCSGASKFFGDFYDVIKSPVRAEENVVALLYRKGDRIEARHFRFEMGGGVICNITD